MQLFFILISSFLVFFCSSKDTTLSKLNEYGVTKSMKKAIQGMTASGLKKDVIQRNLQGHFPDKKLHELNDMIVLANAVDGKQLPRDKHNKKELNRKIFNAQNKMKKGR